MPLFMRIQAILAGLYFGIIVLVAFRVLPGRSLSMCALLLMPLQVLVVILAMHWFLSNFFGGGDDDRRDDREDDDGNGTRTPGPKAPDTTVRGFFMARNL